MRRSSINIDYEVPEGWHRLAVSDDETEDGFDPWFNFIQEIALGYMRRMFNIELFSNGCFRRVEDNFDHYDAGLMTFIKSGEGEEWRLVTVSEDSKESWTPGPGWQVVNITLENMYEFMPRMGYLFTDGLFDLEKVAAGEQKFITRGCQQSLKVDRKYQEYRFIDKQDDLWTDPGSEGFEEVTVSEDMIDDLAINEAFKEEVLKGVKKIIGKL